MELANSTRSLPKATYVRLDPEIAEEAPGGALHKSSFLRSLALQDGEVDRTLRMDSSSDSDRAVPKSPASSHRKSISAGPTQKMKEISHILRQFEGRKLPLELPSPAALAGMQASHLLSFGRQLSRLRQADLDEAKVQPQRLARLSRLSPNLAMRYDLVQAVRSALTAFTSELALSPVGMLNLERLEMTPAGLEKGELISTVPLAPREKTTVIQHEWSTISSEFSSIVTDSLEDYSETGVTESTELAQATTSQNSHSNQFNVTSSASGGCGFVTGSVSVGLSMSDQVTNSATDSRKHAESVTKKASSRVTQSRKVTISTSTTSGSSTSTSRVVENPSDSDPMRIDYFSMMRKWRVGLYRYGLRLTYDITIPEPGTTLRKVYKEMEDVEALLGGAFEFKLGLTDITPATYEAKAAEYGVKNAPAPPKDKIPQRVSSSIPGLKADNDSSWIQNDVNFTIEPGYQISHITLDLLLSNWEVSVRVFRIVGCPVDTNLNGVHVDQRLGLSLGNFLVGHQGSIKIVYFAQYYGNGMYAFNIEQVPTEATMNAWRASVLQTIYDTALNKFTTEQTLLHARLQKLKDQVSGVDTLTLRREENDEIMKCALRWLLGPGFQYVKQDVANVFDADEDFADNDKMGNVDWSVMAQHGRKVTFINEAIEWENVVYFLYSYFWDDPKKWDFIRNLKHQDATRQAFLRAGSARVVLTVRKGYEAAFTWFAEQGMLDGMPDDVSGFPYMTIAQQIQNYDNTNYPGIPPANPTGSVNIGGEHAGTVGISQVEPGAQVQIRVKGAEGFVKDNNVVIDSLESGVQERQKIVRVIKGGRSYIVVEKLENRHGEDQEEFPIYQTGEKGVLIAEWFEYTPSHGTMIGVNSSLDAMS